jgi:hypothetical protein
MTPIHENVSMYRTCPKKSRFRRNYAFNISLTKASALTVETSLHSYAALNNALLFIRSCNWLSVLSLKQTVILQIRGNIAIEEKFYAEPRGSMKHILQITGQNGKCLKK